MNRPLTISNQGAQYALKGYRVQALYSIARILANTDTNLTFIPEGYEDLDITSKDEKLVEVIQIKNLRAPLTFTDLYEKTGTSFLTRCIELKRQGISPKLRVVSFGKLGPEITSIFTNKIRLSKKLEHSGFSVNELSYLRNNIIIEKFEEEACYEACINDIQNFQMAIDPVFAINYLHYWLFHLSEKGGEITYESLRKKLDAIGSFVNERKQFHIHYQNSIRPFQKREFDSRASGQLGESFYQGVAANYDHIELDLDVIRSEKLERINELFRENNIVIVQGVSGQGKSTLAYRYIKDYSQLLAYEITHLTEQIATLKQIQALHSISKSLEVPIILYLDVKPGDEHWAHILQEFAYHSHFRFLVTIREEDWNQTSAKGVTYQYGDLELDFTKSEAHLIYGQLNKIRCDETFTAFEEAWTTFGGKGPLLEFVYLISQGESLKDRLVVQLDNIERESPEFLALLKIVCLADSWMARTDIEKLPDTIVDNKLRLTVESLKNEFLIRFSNDERSLIGLHPIRSKIITDIIHLTEGQLLKTALSALSCINEEDIESFLIQFFRQNPQHSNDILKALSVLNLNHFLGYRNVFQALVWFGMEKFINAHRDLLHKIYETDNFLLSLISHLNFTGTLEKLNLFEDNEQFQKVQNDAKVLLVEAGISEDEVLAVAKKWLSESSISPNKIDSSKDFSAFGEILFWIDHLGLKNSIDISEDVIRNALYNSDETASSKAMFGLYSNNDWKGFAQNLEEQFLEKVASKYQIGYYERDGDSIKAHFLFDLYEDFDSDIDNIIHTRKIQVIDSLRYGLPYLKSHGAQGYGHKLSLIPIEHDESFAQIPVRNNPIDYLVQLNSRLRNLFIYNKRMSGWDEFTHATIEIRRRELNYLTAFLNTLKSTFKTSKLDKLLTFAIDAENPFSNIYGYKVLLPKRTSDVSGRISEGKPTHQKNSQVSSALLHQLFTEYLELHGTVFGALNNFNWQAIKVAYDKMNVASGEKQPHLSRVSLIKLFDAFKRLDDYHKSYRKHFSKYSNAEKLEELEQRELKTLNELVFSWSKFVNSKSHSRDSKSLVEEFRQIEERFLRVLELHLNAFSKKHQFDFIDIHFGLVPKTVVIELDFISPFDILNSLESIHKAISKATRKPSGIDLTALWLEMHCDEIWVIPSIKEMAINNKIYKFKSYNYLKEDPKELSNLTFIPEDAPGSLFDELEYLFFDDPNRIIFKAEEMLKNWQELLINVSITLDIFELYEKDKDSEVLEQRLAMATKKAEKSFGLINDYLSNLLKEFPEPEDYNQYWFDFLELLEIVNEKTLPTPDSQGINGNVCLDIEQIKSWKVNLESAALEIGYFYFHEIERAFKNAKDM